MNLGDLKVLVRDTMNRNDAGYSLIIDYINLALVKAYRNLRLPVMEKFETRLVDAQGRLIIPPDLLQLKGLYFNDRELKRVPRSRIFEVAPFEGPYCYTRFANFYAIRPTPEEGSEVAVYYYKDASVLREDADTDPLVMLAPDLINYGACAMLCDYFKDTERKPDFAMSYDAVLAELQKHSDDYETGDGPQEIYNPSDMEY